MKFICNNDVFTKLLSIADGIVSQKNNITILSNVLIEANNSKVKVTSCDPSLTFFGEIAADVIEEGSISVFSNKIHSISKKFPSCDLQIETDDLNNVIIKSAENNDSIYSLKGIEASKFPVIKPVDSINYFSINQELFIDMINKTKFSVSQNDSRRFANGVLFENTSDSLKMVSTDGKRLAKVEKQISFDESIFNGIIVPLKILNEIQKICTGSGDVKIGLIEKNIVFNIDNYTYISSLLEANFPPYESVIPKDQDYSFKVNKKMLREKIDRISSLGDKESHKIIMFLTNSKMRIYTENMSIGYGEEYIDIEYDKDDLKIALNYHFIIDVLSVLKSDKIIFKFKNAQSTITIIEENNSDYVYIMMPMSL